MLLFECKSVLPNGKSYSEIYESETNTRVAYKAAVSEARYMRYKYDAECAVRCFEKDAYMETRHDLMYDGIFGPLYMNTWNW